MMNAGGTPILRPSLIDTLTTIAGRNHDASGRKAALFEVAAVFHETDQGHEERTATALLMPCENEASLQPIRGCIDRMVSMLTGEVLVATAADRVWSAPGADLHWQDRPIGHVGLLGARDCGRPRAGRTMGRLRGVPGTSAGPLATGNFGRPAPGLPRHRTRFVVGRLGRCSVARYLVVD